MGRIMREVDEADWLPDLSQWFFPGKWEQGFLELSETLAFFADSLNSGLDD